tara:strand:- start:94 stop:534 length:441 start_codon:yes stop_codon:yes gene_type:complete
MDAITKYASKKKLTEQLARVLYGKDPRKAMGKSNANVRKWLRRIGGGVGAADGALGGAAIAAMTGHGKRGVIGGAGIGGVYGGGLGALSGHLHGLGIGAIRKMLPGHRKALKAYSRRKALTNLGLGAGAGGGLAALIAKSKKKKKK